MSCAEEVLIMQNFCSNVWCRFIFEGRCCNNFQVPKIPICAASFMETSSAEEAGRRTFQNATQTKTFRANCVFTVHYSPVCQWFDDNSANIVEQKARGTRIFGKGTPLRVTKPNLSLKCQKKVASQQTLGDPASELTCASTTQLTGLHGGFNQFSVPGRWRPRSSRTKSISEL